MPKRSLDFHKIFVGYYRLGPDDRQRVLTAYQEAVAVRADEHEDYVFDAPSIFDGLNMFFTRREYKECPAGVSRKPGVKPQPITMGGAAGASGHDDADPVVRGEALLDLDGGEDMVAHDRNPSSKEDTHSDPTSPGAASDPNNTTTNGEVMVGRTMPRSLESLKSCSPHDLPRASAMLCSGFTAGIIVECMRDVQRALPDLGDQLAFRKGFSVDVECMTPGDLHTWRVWRVWEDEHLRLQQPISYMLVDEVFSHWWSDKTMR